MKNAEEITPSFPPIFSSFYHFRPHGATVAIAFEAGSKPINKGISVTPKVKS